MLGKTSNEFQRKIIWILPKLLPALDFTLLHRGRKHMHTRSFFTIFYAFQMIEYNSFMFLKNQDTW